MHRMDSNYDDNIDDRTTLVFSSWYYFLFQMDPSLLM